MTTSWLNIITRYNQSKADVERYVDRIDSKEEKYDLYVDLEIWTKAVDTAYRLKDPMRLQEVSLYYYEYDHDSPGFHEINIGFSPM